MLAVWLGRATPRADSNVLQMFSFIKGSNILKNMINIKKFLLCSIYVRCAVFPFGIYKSL